ncbi:MAG: DUF3021 domain-containing protein [Treponema sp.]|nr:DUF3021 domain-containing protein [Treponema sp.]
MIKKILRWCTKGLVLSEIMILNFFILLSILSKSDQIILISPDLLTKFNSPLKAFLFQYISIAFAGILFGLANYIFSVDAIPRLLQFVLHFLSIFFIWTILSLLCHWINFGFTFLLYFLIFFILYLVVYFILLTIEKINIAKVNKKINYINSKKRT